MVEYFNGEYFKWKIEGKVVTMQNVIKPCKGSKEFHSSNREKFILDKIKEWKEHGIEVVEFWSQDPTYATEFHKKKGLKVEVIRTEKDGRKFCRLLL